MAIISEAERSTKEHWERVYERAQSYYGLYLYQQQLVEIIRTWGGNLHGKRILEVGCGKGNELVQFCQSGAMCTGLDFSEMAIQLLKRRSEMENVPLALVQGDARSLPFKFESFDVVFSQGVLEHFTQPSILLHEQYRILRPGGSLVVEVPNKWTLYTIYKKVLMAMNCWAPGWETQYSPRRLKSLLEAAGFQVVDWVGWDFLILKVIRKLKKIGGLREKPETSFTRFFRKRLQRNPLLLYFFSSITVVGSKRA